jgi:hypothetical protein
MSVLADAPRRRGTALLLLHCAVLTRPPAAERLSAELGHDFSQKLVAALARGQRGGAGRRGSSSP